ncbi:hypothetical protein NM688_g9415 [Phlebia brevispora]|uniref:Uncharacterized protein n=1 Tax=Phlebia brevispora TaxID=194682 RepID=A0ACC1RH50_9APHY|nr:hypothetical protein NM688_g9415 [Phlebia brevispora]
MGWVPLYLYYATWLDPAALRVNLNAKLLVDILRHFHHLEKVTIESMLPVDGFRIAELMSQVQDSESDVGQPQVPTDVDKLHILFWDSYEAVHNSVPRLIGLVSLFGKIASLTVDATFDLQDETPDYDTLPPLPNHTRISSMYFAGQCSDPRIARALISPATTSDLTWLEIQVKDKYKEDLRQTLLLPALDPETLCLVINDPGRQYTDIIITFGID